MDAYDNLEEFTDPFNYGIKEVVSASSRSIISICKVQLQVPDTIRQ